MVVAQVQMQIGRIVRAWHEADTDSSTHYRGFREWRDKLRSFGYEDVEGLRLLDIGCGDRAPLSLLSAHSGARVQAIDLLPVSLGWRRPTMWLVVAAQEGPGAAVKQLVRDFAHTWRYWRRLSRMTGRRLPFERVNFRQMDASTLAFPDAAFDVVLSSAVWEHISDVPRATREVNRVLKPGGIAGIQVAVFPALKGGHHAEWHSIEPNPKRTIRPWDHLRKGALPLPLYCNGWRASQYREVFEREMDIAEWEEAQAEGEDYLTPELHQELAGYSDKDLLMPFVTIWARKKVSPTLQERFQSELATAGSI